MKKILIIAHSFPPVNLISSRRAEAYAKYFHLYGFYPTVVTELKEAVNDNSTFDNWKWHSRKEPVRHSKNERFEIYEVPRVRTATQKCIDLLLRIPGIKIISRLILIGKGNTDSHHYHCYQQFRTFLLQHLKQEKYDYILASYRPDFPVKLAAEMSERTGIPFIADYRDIWLNRLSDESNKLTRTEKIINGLSKPHHTKWLTSALFFVIVSEPWRKKIMELTGARNGHVITNGFEKETFRDNLTKVAIDKFYITYTGFVYSTKNEFSFFYKAFNGFVNRLTEEEKTKVRLRFFTHEFADMQEIRENIPEEFLEINSWVSKSEVVNKLKESSILLTFGFTNQRGRYPGKVFEYLGAERNILITPSDKNVLDDLIKETQAGCCSSDIVAVIDFLMLKYNEWKLYGAPIYHGDLDIINSYSRDKQVEKMARLITMHSEDRVNKSTAIQL